VDIEAPVQAAALERALSSWIPLGPFEISKRSSYQALRTYNLHSIKPGFIRANGPAECPGM